MTVTERIWWKDGVVYQIYPASFKDSNGDGLGDIPGIISKIDYLKDLGVDIVWVSPMYKSPQHDMGYDISDYESVHEPYGTVQDMEDLIDACHSRGLRLILDLVINHTSDEHAWFRESRSSKACPKRDWYIWRPPRRADDGSRMPPNNWRSCFGGSAWEWDEPTQEYYLHLFAPQQPDLNWENSATREAIYDSAMRFWLDKGVDGFRIDVVNMYSKAVGLPDAPVTDPKVFDQPAADLFCNGPRMHDYLREMRAAVLEPYGAMTVGELPHTPDPTRVRRYVSAADRQLDMVFQFDIVDLGRDETDRRKAVPVAMSDLKQVISRWQEFVRGSDAWTTVFCENHDNGRSITRFGDDSPIFRELSAKMLALMLCTLTGTLFLYQGQEIGMVNAPESWPAEEYKDVEFVRHYDSVAKRTGGDAAALREVRRSARILGRDNSRLPMQWDSSSPSAGFSPIGTKARPWMRVHDNYPELNVAQQEGDEDSVLNFWKRMIRLRKEKRELFVHGVFEALDMAEENVFTFEKRGRGERAVVVLNFSSETQPLGNHKHFDGLKLLVGNCSATGLVFDEMRPWEGRLYLG